MTDVMTCMVSFNKPLKGFSTFKTFYFCIYCCELLVEKLIFNCLSTANNPKTTAATNPTTTAATTPIPTTVSTTTAKQQGNCHFTLFETLPSFFFLISYI